MSGTLKLAAGKTITLTDDERIAWNLTNRQGLNQSEAADVAGCTRVTINKRVARARTKINRLRLLIAEIGGEFDLDAFLNAGRLQQGAGDN
jgi:predicted DNA-binding protein (UPF0251 family)